MCRLYTINCFFHCKAHSILFLSYIFSQPFIPHFYRSLQFNSPSVVYFYSRPWLAINSGLLNNFMKVLLFRFKYRLESYQFHYRSTCCFVDKPGGNIYITLWHLRANTLFFLSFLVETASNLATTLTTELMRHCDKLVISSLCDSHNC